MCTMKTPPHFEGGVVHVHRPAAAFSYFAQASKQAIHLSSPVSSGDPEIQAHTITEPALQKVCYLIF